ncbi:hypothetical protein [Saccharothrix luteola]|uniref:hypothetical protein n=1 Tax=Saccharothrix luteola TaxID=2893018 RepID=UPI001E2DEFF1|nr:hypothetical protein [Saccharothrix luteola]MCC8251500.1 hypothetical protein [Saccharothrix luteola]
MPVSIRVHDSGAVVVCRDPRGGSALTERSLVAVPAPILRWCGFAGREQVLLVAVPSLSALVIYGQETLDRLLPDPRAGGGRGAFGRWRVVGVPDAGRPCGSR